MHLFTRKFKATRSEEIITPGTFLNVLHKGNIYTFLYPMGTFLLCNLRKVRKRQSFANFIDKFILPEGTSFT
jgi:hypothetical protein